MCEGKRGVTRIPRSANAFCQSACSNGRGTMCAMGPIVGKIRANGLGKGCALPTGTPSNCVSVPLSEPTRNIAPSKRGCACDPGSTSVNSISNSNRCRVVLG